QEVTQQRAPRALVAPIRQEEQERRRRGAHELVEQGRGVDVSPVHVVEPEDERAPLRETGEELAQRAEALLPQLDGFGQHRGRGRAAERGELRQHGEEAKERMSPWGEERFERA